MVKDLVFMRTFGKITEFLGIVSECREMVEQ